MRTGPGDVDAVDVEEVDYPQLLSFRTALRRFLRWSDDAAEAEGDEDATERLIAPGRACQPFQHGLGDSRREEGQGRDRGHEREILRGQEPFAVRGDDREEERHRRPDRSGREADPEEGQADLLRDARPLRAPGLSPVLALLGEPKHEHGRGDRRPERGEVTEPEGIRRPLGEHARNERPERATPRLREPGEQSCPPATPSRVELDERGGRGSADHPHGEPLRRAGGKEPGRSPGSGEQREPEARSDEPGGHDGPPAEPVGHPAEENERRHEDDRVRREDRRQHERREAELLRVDGVERRRQVRARHQHEPREPHGQHAAHPVRLPERPQ